MRPAQPAPITSPDELALEVHALGLARGLDAIGIASAEPLLRARAALEERKAAGLHAGMEFTFRRPVRSTTPGELVEGAAAIVVGARRYESILPPRSDARGPYGAVARYAWTDHYGPLKEALGTVAAYLRRNGYRARVLADDNGLVDREVAHRAGLGWFGKNANLLRPGAGSWFVLGSVVTSAPLPVNESPVADRCGACRRCIDGCPTAAIVAPGVIDAGRCLAWLVQAPGTFPRAHREALGARIYGCDDCQEVCPPNQRVDATRARARSAAQQESPRARPAQDGPAQDERAHAGPAPDHAVVSHVRAADPCPPDNPGRIQAWVSLLDLLEADDETLLARHGRWYLAGRDPRWLRRNALIALGNVADPANPDVAGALARYLGDRDPMLRAHAIWACRRLGREDLLDALVGADEPEVAEELAAAAPVPVRTRAWQQPVRGRA